MKSTHIVPMLSCVLAGLLGLAAVKAEDAPKNSALLDKLIKQTGVYDRSKTGKTPDFVSDPTWPQPLPHSWLLGQIGGGIDVMAALDVEVREEDDFQEPRDAAILVDDRRHRVDQLDDQLGHAIAGRGLAAEDHRPRRDRSGGVSPQP